MANFPTSLPSFTNPSSGDYLNSPAHHSEHSSANDELVATSTKVGINSSAVKTTHDYKLTPRMIADADGGTVTFDLSLRGVHSVTLGGNRTLALSSPTVGQVFVIRLVQDGTGTRTVTWWSTIKWPSGTAPTLTTTGGSVDTFAFICTSSGNYDGYFVGFDLQ